jgi:hypothetical protein
LKAIGDEVLCRLVHDGLLREAGLHQFLAIGAALLAEIEQQALARLRRLRRIVRQFKQGFDEHRRQHFVADLRESRRRRYGDQQRQQQGKQSRACQPSQRSPDAPE